MSHSEASKVKVSALPFSPQHPYAADPQSCDNNILKVLHRRPVDIKGGVVHPLLSLDNLAG